MEFTLEERDFFLTAQLAWFCAVLFNASLLVWGSLSASQAVSTVFYKGCLKDGTLYFSPSLDK
jgi:hypothetical protein